MSRYRALINDVKYLALSNPGIFGYINIPKQNNKTD